MICMNSTLAQLILGKKNSSLSQMLLEYSREFFFKQNSSRKNETEEKLNLHSVFTVLRNMRLGTPHSRIVKGSQRETATHGAHENPFHQTYLTQIIRTSTFRDTIKRHESARLADEKTI